MLAFIVVRQSVAEELPLKEGHPTFCFQCTVVTPDLENLKPSDIVGTRCSFTAAFVIYLAHFLQWTAAKINKQPIFYQKLPVMIIPWRGLTSREGAMREQQGIFDCLMKEDAEENAEASEMNRLGLFEANVRGSSAKESEKLNKVQAASVSPELHPLASSRFKFVSALMSALADSKMAAFNSKTTWT